MKLKSYISTGLLVLVSLVAFEQEGDTPAIESSDPKAIALLDKVSKKLHGATNYAAEFTFTIANPEEEDVVRKGNLIQESTKFFVDLVDQTMTCDGSSVWTHYVDQKEVQITDVEEAAEGFNNPSDFLSIYETEDFIFGILTTYNKGKNVIKEIEFKPTDRSSEYSKVRIVINETKKEIMEVLTFFKNGSRYVLSVDDWKLGISTTAALFSFDASKFPGVHVEDLRF